MKRRHSFGKLERINRNSDYKRLHREGTSYKEGVFILTISRNDVDCHRLGISLNSSLAPQATKRNRLKRLIREVFRLNKHKFKDRSYDILIAIRKPLPKKLDYSMTAKKLEILFKKANLICSKKPLSN